MAEHDYSVNEHADAATDGALQGISVSEPENSLPRVSLEELPKAVGDACRRAGWQSLMPVQSLALPYLLAGRDIMVQSRTGSGKTGCYLLPCFLIFQPISRPSRPWCLPPRVSSPFRLSARQP